MFLYAESESQRRELGPRFQGIGISFSRVRISFSSANGAESIESFSTTCSLANSHLVPIGNRRLCPSQIRTLFRRVVPRIVPP
jgi:hypothetical protein